MRTGIIPQAAAAAAQMRVSSGADPSGSEPALASRVYEIRRLLEEVHSWRRHYHAGRPR